MAITIELRDTETGERVVHALASHGNYSTLCGCSDDDDQFEPVTGADTGQKINCCFCRAIFDQCKALRARDFSIPKTEDE